MYPPPSSSPNAPSESSGEFVREYIQKFKLADATYLTLVHENAQLCAALQEKLAKEEGSKDSSSTMEALFAQR